jgi:hypothetical protein
VRFRLRQATPEERFGVVRSQWLNRILPRRGRDVGAHGLPTARRDVALSEALTVRRDELLVDELAASPDVVVLVVEPSDVPGSIVGWVAYEPERVVHFVCVVNKHGRRGLGTTLLRKAGAHLPSSWSTANGRALQAAARRREENAA